MLTPIEVQSKVFKSSGMGYNKADVDSFFHTLQSDFESLYSENITLKEQINTLNENLNHYREIERSLQKTLVLAETTAEETVLSARKNATVIEQEAVLKAQTIVADAKVDLEKLKGQLADLLKQYESYRAQYKALAQSQMDMLNSDSFNIGPKLQDDISGLEKSASEHIDMLQAVPVNQREDSASVEDSMLRADDDDDETMDSDESIIKNFSDMFNDVDTDY